MTDEQFHDLVIESFSKREAIEVFEDPIVVAADIFLELLRGLPIKSRAGVVGLVPWGTLGDKVRGGPVVYQDAHVYPIGAVLYIEERS